MNVLEKAEKALEYLKNIEGSTKSHELQAAAGTLGRCLGALGSRQNYARHYADLLSTALPTLLSLASNNSAEVRLVGDEALNRAVVGGFAFHSHKANIILQNQIDHTKNARWIRAALNRICIGDTWLRPGVGKIRSQAQTLIPKLSQIVLLTNEIQLVVEALESNLPRVLNALAEYSTDEEITDLSKALLTHVESTEPAVRRSVATCVAHLVANRDVLLGNIIEKLYEKLWPTPEEADVILGWFGVIKTIFQINHIAKLSERSLFSVQDYLELYHLCIHYIEQRDLSHNIQNAVMECLSVLLSQAKGDFKRALLDKHHNKVDLDLRQKKGHKRNFSSASAVTSIASRLSHVTDETSQETSELAFCGALHLGSLSQLQTPRLSVEDLTIQTPDSPASEMELRMPDTEQLGKDLTEMLQELESYSAKDTDQVDVARQDVLKINIGSSMDEDIPLKYCGRLLASQFLLLGHKGGIISDRSIRVSLKSSALSCLAEVLRLYPQAMTVYLDKEADVKCHNISGSSETDSTQDHINDFILERNVCFQESLTESLSHEMFNKSTDSQQTNQSQPLSKKDSKSLEKSIDSIEQKSSSKDVQSNILDSKKDLIASGISADSTNPNMTISNFTTNSNMTGSHDQNSSAYPLSSSGDVLSSSIDLDMKFDHFGESTTNLDNLKDLEHERQKRPLRRTDEVHSKDAPECERDAPACERDDRPVLEMADFQFQHMSDVFVLLEGHSDPQIRGLVRVCVGNYLAAALEVAHGDYCKWRNFATLSKDVSENIGADKLVELVLKGLTDDIHSSVNHSLTALTKMIKSLSTSAHFALLTNILTALGEVDSNKYWLCKVNLCKLYERLPFERLFMICPGYYRRSKLIMDTLFRLLSDQDQKVRNAAANTIARITPRVHPQRSHTPSSTLTDLSINQSQRFSFETSALSIDLYKDLYFYHDLPEQLKREERCENGSSLRMVVGDVVGKLMESSCKNYSQGLLETLLAICKAYPPYNHPEAYSDQGVLQLCVDSLDACNGPIQARRVMIDLCTLVYPVEIHSIMRHRTSNREIFEPDSTKTSRWQHLESDRLAAMCDRMQLVTLRLLNILVHLLEEVSPSVNADKSVLPGTPVRRNIDSNRRTSAEASDDKNSQRKRPHISVSNLKANLVGTFYSEPFYMKLYESLRATYSNHKINLDPKSSIFHEFLTTILNSLAIQLEFSTEKECGSVTEEILYYLKVTMPLQPDKSVFCITQLLKCLFGTNMINQYSDFMSITSTQSDKKVSSFYTDVLLVNSLNSIDENESRRSSVSSSTSQKLTLDKNPQMQAERQMLVNLENFMKNKSDRKWNTNKKELERYIRLFEPVVIQALKSYTMQNDIPLQCQVLCLLNQLLTLRVNYCMLDSDQIFIGFLLKQLDLVEQSEIPNACELVGNILLFLVQLSSSKHHTKQIIEVPKLIQLCDGLLAAGAYQECFNALQPVVCVVLSGANCVTRGRVEAQQVAATREVLLYMLTKTIANQKVLKLMNCALSLSQEQPEQYYRCSELFIDATLNALRLSTCSLSSREDIRLAECLLQSVSRGVLLEQSRVQSMLCVLFRAAPHQATATLQEKITYLATTMILLRKFLVLVPESEILLTINYLKAAHISPQSIFFNVKNDIDPLNVQNVNENCANLSPDVILVRFLFKTLTYAIAEIDSIELDGEGGEEDDKALLYDVVINLIVQVKHMMHLTPGCLFPASSKTAQNILHNEQSGLNTGLYSPEENIPLERLNLICLRASYASPLLTVHWSHLLIRLKFLEQKYWQKLLGFVRNLPLSPDSGGRGLMQANVLQIGCFMAYCEYFVENGLSSAIHLTWLLVNRVHTLITYCDDEIVKCLVQKVQENASASGLLLQAIAARCQDCFKGEFAFNTYKILSKCHESQSGPLVFLICRIIGKMEPALAVRFSNLAKERCRLLKDLPVEDINMQLSKEDLQVALELLQRDKVHVRYSSLVLELNSLATSAFDLSPLDLSQDRAINPQYIMTTTVDGSWLLNQVKSRCCQSPCSSTPKVEKQYEMALLLSNLPKDDLSAVLSCPEFDRKILNSCFKVACDNYLREFLNIISTWESKEIEKQNIREQREMARIKEEIQNVDSNKLNVVNTLHVFKKSDAKESKSQFFIPMNDTKSVNEKFGNLQITEEVTEIIPPELSDLYLTSVIAFDKSLTDVIRLFPKQNRPLSQSENFNLNVEQTIDRYTRRCHQVFQEKLFYREFLTIQSMMAGFLQSLERTLSIFEEVDCDLLEKIQENILPTALAKSIAIFSVISLQYLTFLIKNKQIVESPVHADVSFRVTAAVSEKVVIDNVIGLTLDNIAKALSFRDIWTELNTDSNVNRTQSAISCLYAIVKYFVKDTKPLSLSNYVHTSDEGPKSDIMVTCEKLLTLIEYWETNFYAREHHKSDILGDSYRESVESLLVSLSRLHLLSNVALIPPIAWGSVEVSSKNDLLQKIDLPLQALQDLDVLEAFLFRVNLVGWSSKKQFEEIWVGLLGALQGNGPHFAVLGMQQLLTSTVPKVGGDLLHVPRKYVEASEGLQRLRSILVGTSLYKKQFVNMNLERVSLKSQDTNQGYHFGQFSTEYLKLASEITEDAPFRVKLQLKRVRKNTDIDVNSCLQILMDVATQMLEPKAQTGLAARVSLLSCIITISDLFTSTHQWQWLAHQLVSLTAAENYPGAQLAAVGQWLVIGLARCLQVLAGQWRAELSCVHQKLLKSLNSSCAPLRISALHGCLLQVNNVGYQVTAQQDLLDLTKNLSQHNCRVSLYEQSLQWTVLFTLVEMGHTELMNKAVNFLLANPRHFCADLVVKGITSMIRQQVLPKELKKSIIGKLIDNMSSYSEHHAIQILMVHLFSADNKLLSPKLTSDVSNMDPDILMSSMERLTLLYKILRESKLKESKVINTATLKYFLRETLPPAATLSRVVIEFLETCKVAERRCLDVLSDRTGWEMCSLCNAELVFEVFETAISQDQLPVLSGWIFEALCHLLSGKISSQLLPYCVTLLLTSASPSPFIRKTAPLDFQILRKGIQNDTRRSDRWGIFDDFVFPLVPNMSFADRRLLCLVAVHSGFSAAQIERLRELCDSNRCLDDLLNVIMHLQ